MRVCFVIMPISSGEEYAKYLNRYEHIIRPAVEGFKRNQQPVFEVQRADFISSTGSITKLVLQRLYGADVVIADLTDLNPNVFYELGVRHSLRHGTILLALKGTRIPFDVGDLRVVPYEDRVGGEREAIPKIQRLLETLVDSSPNAEEADSPVMQALTGLRDPSATDLTEAQGQISSLTEQIHDLRTKLAVAEQVNLTLRESLTTYENTTRSLIDRLAPQQAASVNEALAEAAREQSPGLHPVPLPEDSPYDPQMVFVLMPFGPEFDVTYAAIETAAKAAGLYAMRADRLAAPGRITDQIFDAISRAGLIIADVSGTNPNVLYEVGIAHSLRKGTLLITNDISRVPFDIRDQRMIVYDLSAGIGPLHDALLQMLISYAKGIEGRGRSK